VSSGERNQVREPLQRDRVAIVDVRPDCFGE
jgi:hypothetical protein